MTVLQELKESFKQHIFFPRTEMDYWTFRKLRALKSRAVGDKGWNEYFKYLVRDMSLEPSIHERVAEGTQTNLLQLWMESFAENLPYIRYGDDTTVSHPEDYRQQTIASIIQPTPILEIDPEYATAKGEVTEKNGMKIKNAPAGSAIVIGRGPSLFRHKHLEMLAEAQQKGEYTGLVIASDGGFIPALEAGVRVNSVVTVDGAPIIKKYFDHPLVKEHGPEIDWILSVTANHEVYQTGKNAGLKISWFNPMFDDWRQNESWTRLQRLLSRTAKYMRGVPAENAGGNSGACAWINAMCIYKRSPIALIGIDLGYPEDTPLAQTQYYSGILKVAKGDVKIIKEAYKEFYHPVFKTRAYADLIFFHYRQAFIAMQEENALWYKMYGGTINATEGGTLWGSEITCMRFAEFLQRNKV